MDIFSLSDISICNSDGWFFADSEERYFGLALRISGRSRSSRNLKDELLVFVSSFDTSIRSGFALRRFPKDFRNLDLLIRSSVHDILFSEKD
jgi:hypothetical protein